MIFHALVPMNVNFNSHRRGGSLVAGQSNSDHIHIECKCETHPYVNQALTSSIFNKENVFIVHQLATFFIRPLSKLLLKGDVL